jgi:hypothetical protein
MVAEIERKFIRKRQQARIEVAKTRGVYRGRKPSVPAERVRALAGDGVRPSAIARELGISRTSVHRGRPGANAVNGGERPDLIEADRLLGEVPKPTVQPTLTRLWTGSGPPGNWNNIPPNTSAPRSMPKKPSRAISAPTSAFAATSSPE